MLSFILFIKYFHRFTLITILLLTAITPMIFKEHILYVFLYLPVLLVMTAILSVNIENWLNKYNYNATKPQKQKRNQKCIIKRGLCCLHY